MSVSRFVHNVLHWIKGTAVKVSDVFKKIIGSQAADEFAHGAMAALHSELGQVAMKVVESIEFDGIAGLDTPLAKREEAFKQIVSVAEARSLEWTGTIVNMLIEIAVAALKGHFGPLNTVPQQ